MQRQTAIWHIQVLSVFPVVAALIGCGGVGSTDKSGVAQAPASVLAPADEQPNSSSAKATVEPPVEATSESKPATPAVATPAPDSPPVAQGVVPVTSREVDIKTNPESATTVDVDLVSHGEVPATETVAESPARVPTKASPEAPKVETPATNPPKPAVASVNVKDLPFPANAKQVEFDATFKEISLISPSTVQALTGFYRKRMKALGWIEDESAAVIEEDDAELQFAQGQLTVSIDIEADDDGAEVSLDCKGLNWEGANDPALLLAAGVPQAKSLVFLQKELPLPDDATNVEFNDDEYRFLSGMDTKATVEYYAKKLTDLGWTEDVSDRFGGENLRKTTFHRGAISLGFTIFRNRQAPGSRIAIQYEHESDDPDAMVFSGSPDDGLSSEPGPSARGILASKFPVPDGAAEVQREAELEMIIFRSDLEMTNVAKFYRQELGKTGWQEDKEETFLDDDLGAGVVTFAKGDEVVRLVFQDGQPQSKTRIIVQGEGIVWPGNSSDAVADVGEPPSEPTTLSDPLASDDDSPDEEKIATEAVIDFDQKKFSLKHAAAYQKKQFDELVTVVMFSDKAIPMEKLRKSLGNEDASIFDVFGFEVPTYLELRLSGDYTSITCFVEGASLNFGGADVESTARTRKGRVRGKVNLPKPHDFFDKPFRFDSSFDLALLTAGEQPANPTETGKLAVNDDHGLPLPEGASEVLKQRGPYRQSIETKVLVDLAKVVEFYRETLTGRGWKEDEQAQIDTDSASLSFRGPSGPLSLQLQRKRKDTIIKIASSNEETAKEHGIVPEAGKARVMLGNAHTKAVVITVDEKPYQVATGVGARDLSKAVKIDITPGKHSITIEIPGEKAQAEEIEIEADTVWGVIVVPTGGYFADRVY